MDQPGPRHPPLKSPLIERPELQSGRQRTMFGALTFAFWVFWLYLWLPLLALLAWALGLQQAHKYMIVLGGWHEVVRLLVLYTAIIAVLGGVLVAWASYNIVRFTGTERRVANPPITAVEIARDFGMDPLAVRAWQVAQSMRATHDEDGRIARVEILKV